MIDSSWARVLKFFNEKNEGDIVSRKEAVEGAQVQAGTFDTYRRELEKHLFIVKEKRGSYKIIRKVPQYETQAAFFRLPRTSLKWIEHLYELGEKNKHEN